MGHVGGDPRAAATGTDSTKLLAVWVGLKPLLAVIQSTGLFPAKWRKVMARFILLMDRMADEAAVAAAKK